MVVEQIKFPDMMKYRAVNFMDDIEQWWQAAALLRGEALIGSWDSATMHLSPGVEPPIELDQAPATFSAEYGVRIGPKAYRLGIVNAQAATMDLASGAFAVGSPEALPSPDRR